jgi:hypothetical protein
MATLSSHFNFISSKKEQKKQENEHFAKSGLDLRFFLTIIRRPMNQKLRNPHFSSIADRRQPAMRGCAPVVDPT